MSERDKSPSLSVGQAAALVGVMVGSVLFALQAVAQDSPSEVEPSQGDPGSGIVAQQAPKGPAPGPASSFDELNSAATDLNDALAGARAKLTELQAATELTAMAADLRDQLEASRQENNRLAASLAEAQSERSALLARRQEAEDRISRLSVGADDSQIEIANLRQELEVSRGEIDVANAARANAEAQVEAMEEELELADGEVARLQNQIGELEEALSSTRDKLQTANAAAGNAQSERDSANNELNRIRTQIAAMLRSALLGVTLASDEEAPLPEDVADLNLDVLEGEYEAVRASNIRLMPTADSERIGWAKRGETVLVTGKVVGRNWYRVETVEGIEGFIFGDLIRPKAA